MQNLLAQNPFGQVTVPQSAFSDSSPEQAIGKLIQLVIWLLIIGASVYALINLVLAGYSFMAAGDDSKKVAGAWAMIWQTMLGLAISAGAFVLAAIFGQLIFGDPTFILNPTIPPL
ncbi:MAG TPA: hypothetical protein VKC53_00520 [Patescibacteria group bacterium]|nr:hypothetical protein [Patescibacteria group bacterium]